MKSISRFRSITTKQINESVKIISQTNLSIDFDQTNNTSVKQFIHIMIKQMNTSVKRCRSSSIKHMSNNSDHDRNIKDKINLPSVKWTDHVHQTIQTMIWETIQRLKLNLSSDSDRSRSNNYIQKCQVFQSISNKQIQLSTELKSLRPSRKHFEEWRTKCKTQFGKSWWWSNNWLTTYQPMFFTLTPDGSRAVDKQVISFSEWAQRLIASSHWMIMSVLELWL